jgi:hypothetical protein
VKKQRRCEDQRIDSVKNTAMAGQCAAKILDAQITPERAEAQIPREASYGYQDARQACASGVQ